VDFSAHHLRWHGTWPAAGRNVAALDRRGDPRTAFDPGRGD